MKQDELDPGDMELTSEEHEQWEFDNPSGGFYLLPIFFWFFGSALAEFGFKLRKRNRKMANRMWWIAAGMTLAAPIMSGLIIMLTLKSVAPSADGLVQSPQDYNNQYASSYQSDPLPALGYPADQEPTPQSTYYLTEEQTDGTTIQRVTDLRADPEGIVLVLLSTRNYALCYQDSLSLRAFWHESATARRQADQATIDSGKIDCNSGGVYGNKFVVIAGNGTSHQQITYTADINGKEVPYVMEVQYESGYWTAMDMHPYKG